MPLMQVTSNGPGYPAISELSQKAGMRLVEFWDTVDIRHINTRSKSLYVCIYMILTAG